MSDCVWLLRHGATEWTDEDRHTGREDVPLSEIGREQARRAGELLAPRRFEHVLVSPQSRAVETCELAGFGDQLKTCVELVEWDYGDYEGLTDKKTQQRNPGWELFRDGCPDGESPEEVGARVDQILATVGELNGVSLLVAHGKLLRALAARWLGCGVALGRALPMDPAAICLLEREPAGPLLRLWNYTGQVASSDGVPPRRHTQATA
ncbi:MAG: histidine phosphatase family protein [Solirubrobacterales bacterium]|nr:histidine phosphatase family protein [Solirubrobacterales bacterium]